MAELRISVGETIFRDWESVAVTRSIQAASGAFVVQCVDQTVGTGRNFPVAQGAKAKILIGDQPILDGFIDYVSFDADANQHRVTFAGRDRTADLVDCSPVDTPQEWTDVDSVAVARTLAAPFDVEVVAAEVGEVRRIPRFALQPGETAFEAIERACRLDGLLLVTDGQGRLVITRPARTRSASQSSLLWGRNVISCQGRFSVEGRFRNYVVRGQHPGSAAFNGAQVASPEGRSLDLAIRPRRSTVIISEGIADVETLRRRATWEGSVRAARGSQISVVVQGTEQEPGGALWEINQIIGCALDPLHFRGDLLCESVKYQVSNSQGSKTTMGLVRPDAFDVEPPLQDQGGQSIPQVDLSAEADPALQLQLEATQQFEPLRQTVPLGFRSDLFRRIYDFGDPGDEVTFQ